MNSENDQIIDNFLELKRNLFLKILVLDKFDSLLNLIENELIF